MGGAGPHRLDRVERQVVGAAGRADGEGAEHARLGILDQRVERVHQFGRLGGQQRLRPHPSFPPRAGRRTGRHIPPDVGRAHHTAGRALRDRLCEKPFRCGHREQCGYGLRTGALAEDRHVVRVTTELRDVVTHPAQRHHKVPQEQVVLDGDVPGGQRRQVEAPERPYPVVHRDVHTSLTGQRRAVVDRRRRTAEDVTAAVNEDHHRHRLVTSPFRRGDVQRQAVLAHRLVFADTQSGVHALLWSAVAEPVAVAHAPPRLHRPRRLIPQRTDRRLGERNRTPPVHAVTGEALDGAGAGRRSDDVFVHETTVSNELTARASPVSGRRPASLADMRIAVLIAASVLVGGCSQGVGGDAEQTEPSPSAPTRTTMSTPRTTTPTSTTPAKPPEAGARHRRRDHVHRSPANRPMRTSSTRRRATGRRHSWATTSPSPHRRASRTA